jgi:hypothetical protein
MRTRVRSAAWRLPSAAMTAAIVASGTTGANAAPSRKL